MYSWLDSVALIGSPLPPLPTPLFSLRLHECLDQDHMRRLPSLLDSSYIFLVIFAVVAVSLFFNVFDAPSTSSGRAISTSAPFCQSPPCMFAFSLPTCVYTELSHVLGDLLCHFCEMTLEYVHESVISIFLRDMRYRLVSRRTRAHVDFLFFFICRQFHLVSTVSLFLFA